MTDCQHRPPRHLARRALLAGAGLAAAAGLLGRHAPAPAQEKPEKEGPPPPDDVRQIEVTARRITTFQRGFLGGHRFGPLEFRGGLVLSASVKAFGGWSGIVMETDGKHFLAVSDEGAWMTAELGYDGTAPAGIRKARLGPIRGLKGRPLDRKRDLDAESVTLLEGNLTRGTALIGFERNHRIGRFPVVDGVVQMPTGYLKLPPEARRMRTNKSFEAVTVMQGGRYKGAPIAFSERFPDPTLKHHGWIWIGDDPRPLFVTDIDDFELTDAVSLTDGSLILLERRFRWTEGVKMRLRRFAAGEVRPGATLQGEVLLAADMSYEIDNMEGLAAHRNAAGETILTLISDDNFNHFLQRTILLQFALLDAQHAAAGSR